MDDIWHQMAKEWYWFAIVGSIVALGWAPSFLKGKCPACKKRKLTSVIIDEQIRNELNTENTNKLFFTFYSCEACHARFYRERTGPLKDASDTRWERAFGQ